MLLIVITTNSRRIMRNETNRPAERSSGVFKVGRTAAGICNAGVDLPKAIKTVSSDVWAVSLFELT